MINFAHKPPLFPLYLLLDDVRSHLNTGSVFRSADAFGADQIVLAGITGCPPHRDIHKTALGATETVPWEYASSAETMVQKWIQAGVKVYALEQTPQSIALDQFRPADQGPIALILGNEVDGVSESLIKLCTGCLEIPQYGSKHSLNVSVAAGIALHHFSLLRFGV